MRTLTVAALQFACSDDRDTNVGTAVRLIREAAGAGAQLILLPELFETPYFPKTIQHERYRLAGRLETHPTLLKLQALASELQVVLPVSFYERANNAFFNSVAVFDADGRAWAFIGKPTSRMHPATSKNTISRPETRGSRSGVPPTACSASGSAGINGFPETARVLALQGADVIVFPTAIGTEIDVPSSDSSEPWMRVMQGHAAANCLGVIAANRVGREQDGSVSTSFFGRSFVADETGTVVAEAPRDAEAIVVAKLDLDRMTERRDRWGVFRDRRPELYDALMSLDGRPALR